MKASFIVAVCAALCTVTSALCQQHVSFSVQAHPDDWQLFMGNVVLKDLYEGDKVVFITLTAGDAGNGTTGWGGGVPYYVARENGSMLSSKFAADMNGTLPLPNPLAANVTVNGHSISRYIYKNTVNYFLKLPDGGAAGLGNALTGNVSLQKLKEGTIPSISAIDGSATYNGWTDLTQTLLQIVNNERSGDSVVWVYTPSLDIDANSNDHSDHLHSSIAIQDATVNELWVGITEFIDYASASLPANLTVAEHADAAALFSLCVWGMTVSKYNNSFDDGHKSWLPMEYFEVKRIPVYAAPAIANNGFASIKNNQLNLKQTATRVPMFLFLSSPSGNTATRKIMISAVEAGQLQTQIFNSQNILVFNDVQMLTRKGLFNINLTGTFINGSYKVKHYLNGNYYDVYTINIAN